MRHLFPLLVAVNVVSLSACTWVDLAPTARAVKVIPAGVAPSGCQHRSEIEVTITDKVAFYQRNDLKVRDELETLARNEAPGVQANTLQPISEPKDGTQRFAAWSCPG